MWYAWHACRKRRRDILSVVLVLALPRPLDYGRLFVACSAVSAMWALAWGLAFCKELHMLELHFLFSGPPPFHGALRGLAARRVSSFQLFTTAFCVFTARMRTLPPPSAALSPSRVVSQRHNWGTPMNFP